MSNSVEHIARSCAWDISQNLQPSDPKNKDFMEADIQKIVWALMDERSKADALKEENERLRQENDSLYAYKTVRGSHLECENERLEKELSNAVSALNQAKKAIEAWRSQNV